MGEEKGLDISWEAIMKIAIASFVFYIIYLIRDILVLFVFALIISILFNPAINFLEKKRIPRVVSTVFVYVAIFGILSLILYSTAPVFVAEIQQFSQLFPQYFEKLSPPLEELGIQAFESFETFTQAFQDWLVRTSSSIFGAIVSVFGGIFSTITIFSIAIFLSIEEKGIERAALLLLPKKYEAYFLNLWERCQAKTIAWFGTRVLSCIFIGMFSYLAFQLFKMDYAFALSLFAGITNIIPILGPIFAGLIIAVIAALDSWVKALLILVVFILIQQVESNILTPILTKKFVGIPAVLVIISLMVGAKLWGILGAILAIPLFGILFEFLKEFLQKRKETRAVVL